MANFTGFTANETFTPIPDNLFRLLGEITDINELNVTFYLIWRVEHIEGPYRQISISDILEDANFVQNRSKLEIEKGLNSAVIRGTLLSLDHNGEAIYFLNSPRGRASLDAFVKGGSKTVLQSSLPPREVPNIFKIYEENIGAITPMMADTLKDAEKTYQPEWIEEAVELAVKLNKRNWKYIEAILSRWKEEGRGKKQNRRNDQTGSRGNEVTRQVDEFLGRKR